MLKIKKMMALSILLLSGCQGNNTSSAYVSSTSNPITSTTSSSTSIITANKYNDIFYDGYYKTTEQSVYYKDVRKQYRFKNDLPSIGNQKILVVPITFTDSTFVEEELGGHEKVKNDLETMFFGEAEETSWESVSSFYKKSSYNKLNLSGKVADWFNIDMTFSQASSLRLPYGVATPSVLMAREVAEWYKKTYNDISEYDLDNNGYIDALWIVYDWPAKHLYDGSFDWAHCYWDYTNTQEPEEGNPIPYTYAYGVVVVNSDNADISSFEDLDGKQVALTTTSNWAKLAESYGATIVPTNGFSESIQLVLQGRADATVNDNVTYLDYIAQQPDAAAKIAATSDDATESALLIRKADTDLQEAINAALTELIEEGTISEISEKYFGEDISKK